VKVAAALAAATLLCVCLVPRPAQARERVHYIAADEVVWNYAPQHREVIANRPLPPLAPAQLGWVYQKAVYREYTDRTFDELLFIPSQDRYQGLVGPVIHAEVSDTVVIVFRNRTQVPVDIAPAGLPSTPMPAPVAPGATRTFRWPIRESDGPTSRDLTSVLYAYESDVRPGADENAGLIGPLIVTRQGSARADGSPIDVDREIIALYSVQQESLSPLVETNLRDRVINPRSISGKAKHLLDDNEFATINGYIYGNMPPPVVRTGQRVRWYLLSTHNSVDFHAPTWDGQTVLWQNNRLDSVPLSLPHAVADMVPDDPGVWLLTCSLNVHLFFGMEARYKVLP
jgi:manganese oxidase